MYIIYNNIFNNINIIILISIYMNILKIKKLYYK